MMANESTDTKDILNAVIQVIQNCIIDDIDVKNLPLFDLQHLFINLRSRSVNEIITLSYRCNNNIITEDGIEEKCNSLEKFEIDLTKINPIVDKEHNKKIMLTDKMGIVMKYPTIEIISNLKTTKEEDIVIELLEGCIDFVFDSDNIYYAKDNTSEELEEFIDNLQQKDLEKIQNFFQTIPKIKEIVHFSCKKCGYKEEVDVEGLENFFV
jgi:DNA-directed RNA polymerase subunit M/transcription elongation factor TFIIS